MVRATPLHPSIINPSISGHPEDTGLLFKGFWDQRDGSHSLSFLMGLVLTCPVGTQSCYVGNREGRRDTDIDTHTHTHPTDPNLCVWKLFV